MSEFVAFKQSSVELIVIFPELMLRFAASIPSLELLILMLSSSFSASVLPIDDYLPKPFSTDELLARVKALLRRRTPFLPTTIECGDLCLNTNNCELKCENKKASLSAKEMQILELFMRSPNVNFSTDAILDRVWGWECGADESLVWVNISNIRKHLRYLKSKCEIKTVRGIGYAMVNTCDE